MVSVVSGTRTGGGGGSAAFAAALAAAQRSREAKREAEAEAAEAKAIRDAFAQVDLEADPGKTFQDLIAANVPVKAANTFVDNIAEAQREAQREQEAAAGVTRGKTAERVRVTERTERLERADTKETRRVKELGEKVAREDKQRAIINALGRNTDERAERAADLADKANARAEKASAIADKAEERAVDDQGRKQAQELRDQADELRRVAGEARNQAAEARSIAEAARQTTTFGQKQRQTEAFVSGLTSQAEARAAVAGEEDLIAKILRNAAAAGPTQGPKLINVAEDVRKLTEAETTIEVDVFRTDGSKFKMAVPKSSGTKERERMAAEAGGRLGVAPTITTVTNIDTAALDFLRARGITKPTGDQLPNARRAIKEGDKALKIIKEDLLELTEGQVVKFETTASIKTEFAKGIVRDLIFDGETRENAIKKAKVEAERSFNNLGFLPVNTPRTMENALQFMFSRGAGPLEMQILFRGVIDQQSPGGSITDDQFKAYILQKIKEERLPENDDVNIMVGELIDKATRGLLEGIAFNPGAGIR